jgi:hypothetical protein
MIVSKLLFACVCAVIICHMCDKLESSGRSAINNVVIVYPCHEHCGTSFVVACNGRAGEARSCGGSVDCPLICWAGYTFVVTFAWVVTKLSTSLTLDFGLVLRGSPFAAQVCCHAFTVAVLITIYVFE